MQGRLSPPVDGKIQAFPADHWRSEFALGAGLGFDFMEWTLDHEGLHQNPLMSREGRGEIRQLSRRSGLKVVSATLDCVMQAPFYKSSARHHDELLNDLASIIEGAGAAGIDTVVVPLVDDGAITSPAEETTLREGLGALTPILQRTGVRIAFESDLAPAPLATFIDPFSTDHYGLTYDIGNSAAAGFDPAAEFAAYGDRVSHVHIKDRVLGGATVALGAGQANFVTVFEKLHGLGYAGRYVLQTARADDDNHAALLDAYRAQVLDWLAEAEAGRSDKEAVT